MDTSSWLTSQQVVDQVGIAYVTLKGWVRRGRLHPEYGTRKLSNGVVREVQLYDPKEVARFPPASRKLRMNDPGELAAAAFDLFDDGKSQRQVVVALRQTPERVAQLHEQWLECGGCELVLGEAAQAQLASLLGPFDGVAGLVERVVCQGASRFLDDASIEEIARFVGPFDGVAGLVQRVRDLHAVSLEATVPDDVTDAEVERAILRVLDGRDATTDVAAEAEVSS